MMKISDSVAIPEPTVVQVNVEIPAVDEFGCAMASNKKTFGVSFDHDDDESFNVRHCAV